MTTAFVIAAVVILIVGLFAVIVERTNERDEARENADRDQREYAADLAAHRRQIETLRDALMAADQENAILSGRLQDVASVPLVPFDSLSREERAHIAADRPDLRIVQSPIPMQRRGAEWDAIMRAVEEES